MALQRTRALEPKRDGQFHTVAISLIRSPGAASFGRAKECDCDQAESKGSFASVIEPVELILVTTDNSTKSALTLASLYPLGRWPASSSNN